MLMRLQGLGVLSRIRRTSRPAAIPGRELAHGVDDPARRLLLLIPGFVTDISGLLLFLPPVRDLVWRFLRSRISVSAASSGRACASDGPADGGNTIDLDADDYSGQPTTELALATDRPR